MVPRYRKKRNSDINAAMNVVPPTVAPTIIPMRDLGVLGELVVAGKEMDGEGSSSEDDGCDLEQNALRR